MRPADKILQRHHADSRKTAVAGIVPVVAHHEIVARGYGIDAGVVRPAHAVAALVDRMAPAGRQNLAIQFRRRRQAAGRGAFPAGQRVVGLEVADIGKVVARQRPCPAHLLAVQVQPAVPDLDAVARNPDDPLDEIDACVVRLPENRHIATLWRPRQDSTVGDIRAERDRVVRIAVAEFRDEQVVALVQAGIHRIGGNIERLVQERAHDQGDQDGIEDRLQRAAGIGFFFGRLLRCLGFAHRTTPCNLQVPDTAQCGKNRRPRKRAAAAAPARCTPSPLPLQPFASAADSCLCRGRRRTRGDRSKSCGPDRAFRRPSLPARQK